MPITIPADLPPSIIGKLVDVRHELQIFVKHDAWNAWGKGKVVTKPILLKTRPSIDAERQFAASCAEASERALTQSKKMTALL